MEYLIIFALQFIGIGLHAAQKMLELDKKFPDDSLRDVADTFFKEDRITLIISGLVLAFNLLAHYILDAYTSVPASVPYYILWAFGIAFVLGYGGQRIVYKYLGKAESVLIKKADSLN